MLLRHSFRKGTAELTYRNRDMGSKPGRLNCLMDRESCVVVSRRLAIRISTVLPAIPTEFLFVISCISSSKSWILPSVRHDRSSKPALVCYL